MNFQDLHNLDGIQFIPVNAKKIPTVKAWQTSDAKHDLTNSAGVGIVCGKLSNGIEVIDVDEKYDITGNLFDRYKKIIHSIDELLLPKLVVQKTKSGGHHLIYRCSIVAGNLKLANRPTTEEEKNHTYKATYETFLSKSSSDEEARKQAQKARDTDRVRVLFETRGEGGYIMCWPSPGYELVYRDYYGISNITPEEREILLNTARQFNEVYEEYSYKPPTKNKIRESNTFDDYNDRGDVIALLESHGWKIVGQKGHKTIFLRPGQTTSSSSGNYDHEKKWFSVFTTSTEFEPCKAYLPYAVYAVLECNKDFSEASKMLFEMGFGERQSDKKNEKPSTRVVQSRINPETKDKSAFATSEDYDNYLQQVRDGTLVLGKTTGSPKLDEHFLLKPANFVHINGIDNTGKTEVVWWLELLAAMYHGWKGVIFSSENTLGAFMRRMIQFYWGKPLSGAFAMNQKEFEIAKSFIEKHFLLIKAQEDLYNYKDIINLVRIALQDTEYNYGMIDPYNSLKIDLSGFSKLNTHEYHYEALSELKAFGQKNNFGWFVTHHAVTAALRLKDGDKKYPVAPRKEDTEQGGKVPNKADDFLTVHRLTQHPTDWMITEIHVRKIKDTETGGRPTSIDEPIKFERYKGGYAYVEVDSLRRRGVDPIYEWHIKSGTFPKVEMFITEQSELWTPYKDDAGTSIGF